MNQKTILIPEKEITSNQLFPVFLKLEHMRLLIIGGGKIGLEKLHAVLYNSPATRITLVATEVQEAIWQLAKKHENITIIERQYNQNDLLEADLVIVAVNDIPLAEQIRFEAKEKNLLVNVADKPGLCDFYLSSVVKKGNLKIAISTNGKSPTIAKRLKETFNEAIPEELDEVLDNMQSIRNKLHGDFEHKVKKLNELTKVLVEKESTGTEKRWRKIASLSLFAFAMMLIGHFVLSYLPLREMANDTVKWYGTLDKNFPWMVLAGFLAQMVDGATSMGYGVTSAIILMSANVSPAAISGSIHTAEMFASGASGYSRSGWSD